MSDSVDKKSANASGEEDSSLDTKKLVETINDFAALYRQGTVLLHKGKAAAAVPYLEKAHDMRPDDVDAGINLAGAYILSKKFSKAVRVLEPLSESGADNPMIWTNLGAAYLGNPVLANDPQQLQAIGAFEKALELDPKAPSVAYNIGLIYRDRKETAEAIKWFERAAADNPNDPHARSLLKKLQAEDKTAANNQESL